MAEKRNNIIQFFIHHRVAANLLMLVMLLAGAWSLFQLNTQFLPTFSLKFITVDVRWPGASAEDIERSVTIPIEQELRTLDDLKEIKSISRESQSHITLEFEQNADMAHALDQAKEQVALVRNLPQDAEEPIITRIINFEPIAKVLITGPGNLNELRPLAHKFEHELLDRGIAKVTLTGLTEQEIAIQVPTNTLAELKLSLNQIASKIANLSRDLPAGTVGKSEIARQIRSLSQQRDPKGFDQLPLMSDESGRLTRIGDIATIQRRPRDNQVQIFYQGKPAIQLNLFRTETASALKSADILQKWMKDTTPSLSKGVQIHVYEQSWQYIQQRINLLIKNGVGGFILILIVLFFFLNRQVAFWVAMGIPISIMASLAVLFTIGGSINMVSLFAFIMTLGIIVDDTIVVGEETLTQLQLGKDIHSALTIGTHRMLPPILASSLTTIAAFLPLMLIGDIIGKILLDIPLVVICVILASLIECFFVLPGHLRHSFEKNHALLNKHKLRKKIDNGFEHFKQQHFRRFVSFALHNHWLTLSTALAIFILSIGLIIGERVNFTFFPSPDGSIIRANIQFTAGTPKDRVKKFLGSVEQALQKTDKQLSKNQSLVVTAVSATDQSAPDPSESANEQGREFAHVYVELTQPDDRDITNRQFIQGWRKNITLPPDIENFTISAPRTGPPGKDLDIKISGSDSQILKQVAQQLMHKLTRYQGVSNIHDNLAFGEEQLIFDLNAEGRALGLTTESIGRQLRAAFSGAIVQIFHEAYDEVEVRVILPNSERYDSQILEQLPIITEQGTTVPLGNVVTLKVQRGFNMLRHTNTRLSIHVTADIDAKTTNSNKMIASLNENVIPSLIQQYNVKVEFEGRATEQADTLRDMKYGMILALSLVYIILAWVFSSYSLPIIILLTVPLGLTGAIYGHWVMEIDLTLLSLFGLFGLSGIVINDSIILVNRYLRLRNQEESTHDIIAETSCQRLRAVILTSLTTIAGLTPLLFETSLQAQFLIPMAVSICFGLAFSTLLVLVVVPCLLMVYENLSEKTTLFGISKK